MSNMQKMCHNPFAGKSGCAAGGVLQEYQRAKQLADASEARLDEYCSAIEDFGLEVPGRTPQGQIIYCRERACTPAEILARAEAEAARLEKLTASANDARGRVLVTILRQSRNLTEYRALRWLYVDSAEEKQRAVDAFPSVQGHVS
jgi:hypothetical protein